MGAIFVSHSTRPADGAWVRKISEWLQSEGYTSFYLSSDDEHGNEAGVDWSEVINDRLRSCEAVIALVSPDYERSTWCFAELQIARLLGKRILPLSLPLAEEMAPVSPEDAKRREPVRTLLAGVQSIKFATMRPHPAPEEREKAGFTKLRRALEKLSPAVRAAPSAIRPPYPGFRPFEAEDAGFFFGRDAIARQTVERLRASVAGRSTGTILLTGPSGSGKSSLLRAGVLPRLHDEEEWLVLPTIRPGKRAFRRLAQAFRDGFPGQHTHKREGIESLLEEGSDEAVRQFLTDLRGSGRNAAKRIVVLPIDQMEELTTAAQPEAAEAFLRCLGRLGAVDRGFIAIGTLRSDLLGALQVIRAFQDIRFQVVDVPPLSPGELASIIREPALRHGLRVEEGLVRELVADAQKARATLPLVAYALMLIYERREGDHLAVATYRDIGRLTEIIDMTAGRIMQQAQPEEREVLRRTFVPGLVDIAPDGAVVRQTMLWDELDDRARKHLNLFAAERLVTLEADETGARTVEIAHESLVQHWTELRDLVEQQRWHVYAFDELAEAARRWKRTRDEGGHAEVWLVHRGERLAKAKAAAAMPHHRTRMTSTERDYLFACEKLERQRRQRRNIVFTGALVSSIVFCMLSGVIWLFRQQSERNYTLAQQRYALALGSAKSTVSALRDLAGVGTTRAERILTQAEEQAELLSSQAGGDPALELFRAGMQIAYADTYLALGNAAEATARIAAALDTARRIRSRQPNDPEAADTLAQALKIDADVLQRYGQTAQAFTSLQEMLQIRQQLHEEAPRDLEAMAELATAHLRTGDLLLVMRQRDRAGQHFDRSLAIRQKIAGEDRGNRDAQRQLAVTLERIATISASTGDRRKAEDVSLQALEIRRNLHRDAPLNQVFAHDLVVSLSKAGLDEREARGLDAARIRFREAIAIAESVLRTDPFNLSWKRERAILVLHLADLDLAGENTAAAEAGYTQFAAVMENLLELNPAEIRWQDDLALALTRLGDTARSRGRESEAYSLYERAMTMRERLAEADPVNARWQIERALLLARLNEMLLQSGETAEAQEGYAKALSIVQTQIARDPENVGWLRQEAHLMDRQAQILALLDRPMEALAMFETASLHWGRLLDRDPVGVVIASFAEAETRLAEALRLQSRGGDARERLLRGLERLRAGRPPPAAEATQRRMQASLHLALAGIDDQPRRHLRTAIGLLSELDGLGLLDEAGNRLMEKAEKALRVAE